MTTTEFLWKMKNIDFRKAVLIVGDSRVGWGFSQDAFNDELQRLGISNISGFNGGMAGTGVEYTIKSIVESETGKKHLPRLKGNNQTAPGRIMIVGYSPASFYCWGPNYFSGPFFVPSLWDLAVDTVSTELKQRFSCLSKKPISVVSEIWNNRVYGKTVSGNSWVSRVVYPDGIINARLQASTGQSVDTEEYQLSTYRKMFDQMLAKRAATDERKNSLQCLLRQAKSLGWRIAIMRMPTSANIHALEQTLPAEFQPEAFAREVGVQFFDHGIVPIDSNKTIDGSHLTPTYARDFSRQLAADASSVARTEPLNQDPAE